MDETQNANTQASPPAAEAQAPNAEVAPKVPEGVQKRFDELTAQIHEARRSAQSAQEQNAQLVAALAQRESAQTPPEPAIEIDPDERKRTEAVVSPRMKQLEAKFDLLLANQAQAQIQGDSGVDAVTAKQAHDLYRGWQARGIPGNAEDAVDIIVGKQARLERKRTLAARGANREFNSLAAGTLLAQSAALPPQAIPSNGALPDNFHRLDADQQIEVLRKRGVDNEPL